MKDRYLFKAQGNPNKSVWYTGLLSDIDKINIKQRGRLMPINVIKETICQCTGLKDRGGNLIFEGDIVWDYQIEEKGEVSWHDGGWRLSDRLEYSSDDYKIIGNIHDMEEK